jgi:hypothetical protein
MEMNGLKVLEGRLENISLKKFLNPKFLELIEKELDDAKVIHLGIASGPSDDQNVISLAHIKSEHANDNILSIRVRKEEQMDQIISVIKLFNREE